MVANQHQCPVLLPKCKLKRVHTRRLRQAFLWDGSATCVYHIFAVCVGPGSIATNTVSAAMAIRRPWFADQRLVAHGLSNVED